MSALAAYEPQAFDVVIIPFPFTDDPSKAKRRPVIVLSDGPFFNRAVKQVVCAMVTSTTRNPWPGDIVIRDLAAAGMKTVCKIRMKLFTLDSRLILRHVGKLGAQDRKALAKSLHSLLPFA